MSTIPVYHQGDDVPLDAEEYDYIEFGYRLPDGTERFGYNLQYSAQATDLSTVKGQRFAQEKFEKTVKSAGLVYDQKVHGRLEFIQRIRQIRYTASKLLVAKLPSEVS